MVGVIFGLRESSPVETSLKQEVPCGGTTYISAAMQDAMGYSFNFDEWCGSETFEDKFHTDPFPWIPSYLLLLGIVLAIYQLIWSNSSNFGRISPQKQKKVRLKVPFWRHYLPYHLALCCFQRKGNRPPPLSGPSRRAIYLAKLTIKRAKRKRYHNSVILKKYMRVYEACISMPNIATFRLGVIQDESKI